MCLLALWPLYPSLLGKCAWVNDSQPLLAALNENPPTYKRWKLWCGGILENPVVPFVEPLFLLSYCSVIGNRNLPFPCVCECCCFSNIVQNRGVCFHFAYFWFICTAFCCVLVKFGLIFPIRSAVHWRGQWGEHPPAKWRVGHCRCHGPPAKGLCECSAAPEPSSAGPLGPSATGGQPEEANRVTQFSAALWDDNLGFNQVTEYL